MSEEAQKQVAPTRPVLFEEDRDKIAKMLSTNEVAAEAISSRLIGLLEEYQAQYKQLSAAVIAAGGDRAQISRANRMHGEIAMLEFIIEEFQQAMLAEDSE